MRDVNNTSQDIIAVQHFSSLHGVEMSVNVREKSKEIFNDPIQLSINSSDPA